jgi:hypothetical protein
VGKILYHLHEAPGLWRMIWVYNNPKSILGFVTSHFNFNVEALKKQFFKSEKTLTGLWPLEEAAFTRYWLSVLIHF